MNPKFELDSFTSDVPKEEELHIGKKSIHALLCAFKYQDKETNQYIIYIPSLEVSAYGETKEKALEMIRFSLEDYCKYLLSIPSQKVDEALLKLGWKHHAANDHDYSKSYIDLSGDLKDFAVNELVEKDLLQA